jgi:hypothetical protein
MRLLRNTNQVIDACSMPKGQIWYTPWKEYPKFCMPRSEAVLRWKWQLFVCIFQHVSRFKRLPCSIVESTEWSMVVRGLVPDASCLSSLFSFSRCSSWWLATSGFGWSWRLGEGTPRLRCIYWCSDVSYEHGWPISELWRGGGHGWGEGKKSLLLFVRCCHQDTGPFDATGKSCRWPMVPKTRALFRLPCTSLGRGPPVLLIGGDTHAALPKTIRSFHRYMQWPWHMKRYDSNREALLHSELV